MAGVAPRFPTLEDGLQHLLAVAQSRRVGTHPRQAAGACAAIGREEKTPTAAILDSQSVKTTEVGGAERGYDASKKVTGRKRQLVVDTLGLVLAVAVHAASVQDHQGARRVVAKLKEKSKRLKVILADSAYGRNKLPEWICTMCG